ncbi:MAG: hypothetical protein A2219_03030 [Elusimicrobia bacterium RIFOXYA2_FULL_50_26]|nr:MAG: hypothetical protein A2219_03030 [Elusimicrobia bacterium RIFOXYA2_FULL_50_26]OGS25270.1 MAG: hypothetical protein A2314_03450 [Elusimicrobia bacterium RIFOXYB2_FULL_50_12]
MKLQLSEITEIKSGYLFKTGFPAETAGNISVIQLKDVDNNGILHEEGIQKIIADNISPEYYVKKGDILFKAKTNRPASAVVTADITATIATAHYFIIRITTSDMLPGYLSWYLNQRKAQMYFAKNAGGTRIQVITKQLLGNLEVIAPALPIQEKIVKINWLLLRENQISDLLKEKKQKFITSQLCEFIKA